MNQAINLKLNSYISKYELTKCQIGRKCEKENVRKVSRIAEKFRVLESPQESSL